MRRTWVQNRGHSGNSSRHLSHALYKPNSSFHAASVAAAQSNTQLNTVPPVPHTSHPSSSTLEVPHVEYGDYFPLLAGRSPEDQLTPLTTQIGYLLNSAHITDETRILSRSVPLLREKRARIKEKILEFSHVAPKKQRVSRSLPTPVIGLSKEAREEWLKLLSLEQVPLTELSRLPIPHGVRGAAFLEEMSSRNVPHLRALWFLKLLSSQPDFIGGSHHANIAGSSSMSSAGASNISLGISSGGSANSRSSAFNNQIAARNRAWMDEIKKTLENLANEMAMAWKPASSAASSSATSAPASTSSASSSSSLSIISSLDQTFLRQLLSQPPSISFNSFSTSTPFAGLESQLQLCGLELTSQPVQGGSSGSGPASNTPAGLSAAFASSSVPSNSAAATLSNTVGGPQASSLNTTAPPSTVPLTAEARWKRLVSRWEYIFDLFELGLSDGIFSRGVFLSWISEHLLQLSSQNWNFCASLVRYLLFSHALIRVLPLVQLSRNHAHRLFQAMKMVYEKCLAIEYGYCNTVSAASSSASSTSPAASSSSSATVWMQVAQPFMSQFVQVFIRYLSSVMPHTQAWFTQRHRPLNVPFAINTSGNPTQLEAMDGWKWEWIHHFDDSSDESDMEGDEEENAPEDSYNDDFTHSESAPSLDQSVPSHFVCVDIDMGLDEPTVKAEGGSDIVVKMEDVTAAATESTNGSASFAPKSSIAKFTDEKPNILRRDESESTPVDASSFESLLYLSGSYSFSHQQSWQCFFPRLLNHLNVLSTATMESDPQSHFSVIPCVAISSRSIGEPFAPLSIVSPDRIHFAFHPSMNVPNASSTSVEMFDATSYLTQTTASLSSNSAILAHIHFLRSMTPHFHKGPLQLLMHWSIRGAICTNSNALLLVVMILHTYLPLRSSKKSKQRVAASASRHDISHAALEFLLAFRPASRLELTRLVRLYELLCCMQLFPYETFLEKLLVTGVIHPELLGDSSNQRALRSDARVDLSDWISLGQYYLRHLPMPTPAVDSNGTTADSGSTPTAFNNGIPSTIDQCELPATAWKKSHRKLVLDRATPRLIELLDIKHNSMTGVSEKSIRTLMNLVYLDVLWLWQNEFANNGSAVFNLHFLEFGRQKRQQLLQQGRYWHVDDRVVHARTWRQRSRAVAVDINTGEFPSMACYLDPNADEQNGALSSAMDFNAVRNRSPILPAPVCSAASLLFTLPLPSVSFLLDHLLHSLQMQIDSLSCEKENEKMRKFQLLASAEFNSILMQLVELLELTESKLLLQRALFWCIDLLLAFVPPQSPPLPMLESLLFGLIRRHYSLIICLGMDRTLKTKLSVLIRAQLGPQPQPGTTQFTAYGTTLDTFLDSVALPVVLSTSLRYLIFERAARSSSTPAQPPMLQQQASCSQHPFLSLSSEQQMYVDQMSWDMHLRRALQVCSSNVTDYSSGSHAPQNAQVSLYQVCAMVPLSAPGLATFLRELFRAFIQSSLGSLVAEGAAKPRANVATADVEATSRSRAVWMQSKWNKLVQCIAHIEHRLLSSFLGIGGGGPARATPNMNASRINLTELFFAQLIRVLFVLKNDSTAANVMTPVQQVLSQLEIPPATVAVLPSAALLQQHLSQFLLQVLTSDLGYSWRASKVLQKLAQAALNQAPELKQKETIWRLCESITLCDQSAQSQTVAVVSSIHQLKLRWLIWQESILDYIPFARTFQEATKQQLLLISAPLSMSFAMQPRVFVKDILPLLTSSHELEPPVHGLPRPLLDFIRTAMSTTEVHRFTEAFAVKSEQQQVPTEERMSSLLKMLTPWNTQTFCLIFQMLCMDLHGDFKTKFDPSIIVRHMLIPCMSNAAALTPSSACTSPLQPFEFGSRLECARQLLQTYAQATFVHEQLSSLLSHSFDLELQQLLVMHEHTAREQKDRSAKQIVESIVQSHYQALMHVSNNNSKLQQKHRSKLATQYDAFVASTFLLASPHPELSNDPLPPLCLRILDQISLSLAVALQTPFSALPTPAGAHELSLHERIQQALLKRIRSLYGLLPVIYSSRPLEYERLLKHILMLLMLVSEVPSTPLSEPVAATVADESQENSFFLQLLQLFQYMMDVVSFGVDEGKIAAANRGGGSGSGGGIAASNNGAPSSSSSLAGGTSSTAGTGEQILFELQGLFYMACRSLRLSEARRILLAQSFDNGHGALEEDVHFTTPFVATGVASANAQPLLQDPWMLLEGLPSTPFIDLCYEQSKPAANLK